MTDEQRPDAQLGTGAPRSELESEPVETTVPPDPADDQPNPNRSGSGGSGASTDPSADAMEEGSTDQSMDELLGGQEHDAPPVTRKVTSHAQKVGRGETI